MTDSRRSANPDYDLVSPIFPLARDSIAEMHGNIAFLFPKEPASLLGRFQHTLTPEQLSRVWLSHGLAAVLFFSGDSVLLKEFTTEIRKHLNAWEVWPINDGQLDRGDISVWKEDVDRPNLDVVDLKSFPHNIRLPISELFEYLRAGIRLSTQFSPEQVALFENLWTKGRLFVDQLAGLLPADTKEKTTELHYFLSQIVDVNSCLAYSISQAYGGSSPILDNPFQIHRYSLLGIGTAHRAIFKYYTFIQSVFDSFDLDERIESTYPKARGIEIFRSMFAFDPEQWSNHRASVAQHIQVSKLFRPHSYHIVYFSSRWGFHESLHSISVASQCISSVSDPSFNLLTFSHEYLHSHVRRILAAIFPDSDEQHERLVEAFNSIEEKRQQSFELQLSETIYLAILNYANQLRSRRQLEKALKSERQLKQGIPSRLAPNEARELVKSTFGLLNEIVVHTLDFLYFYRDDVGLYVRSLWQSWSAVPAVSRDLAHYLQRTICAVAVSTSGAVESRFQKAVSLVKEALEGIEGYELNPSNAIVAAAVRMLSDRVELRYLKNQFGANLYVVELSKKFFYSPDIHGHLIHDTQSHMSEWGPTYAMKPGEFFDEPIDSPVAFARDHFRKRTAREVRGEDIEYESLWHFLVIASTKEIPE